MEEIVNKLAYCWNERRSPDEHDLVDLLGRNARIGQCLLAGAGRAVQYAFDELLEDFARNLALVAVAVGKLDIKLRRCLSRQADLGANRLDPQGLHGIGIPAQVNAVLGVNLVERDRQQEIVDIVAAEVRIAVGGLHLENSVAQLEN